MRKTGAFVFIPIMFTLLCAFQPPNRTLSPRIGVVSWRDGRGCLTIRNPADLTKNGIRMVSLLADSPARAGRVIGKTAACDGSISDPEARYWLVDLGAGAVAGDFPAVGVLNFTGPFHRKGAEVSADVDHDGRPEYFRSCTSAEGVHFTAWKGAPLKGQLRWHQYFYLGYDTEPTCTAAETEEEKK